MTEGRRGLHKVGLANQILAQDPKILRLPAEPHKRAFLPIPLAVLMSGERLTFPLFLKATRFPDRTPDYFSCLAEGEEVQRVWLDKLQGWGLDQVYVHERDLQKAIAYLNNHLLLLDRQGELKTRELLVLREHLNLSLQMAFQSPQLAKAVGAAKASLDRLLALLKTEAIPWKVMRDLLYQDYTLYHHSVNVAVLGLAFAAFLQHAPKDCLTLGLAGLFHDVGLTQISDEIVQKRDPLTPEERDLLRKHPCLGYRLLKGNSELPLATVRLVLEHHELADGSGYPQRLPLKRQHPLSRLLSLLEVYDGLTIYRPYRPRQSPFAALKTLQAEQGERGPAFEPRILKKFIEFLALG